MKEDYNADIRNGLKYGLLTVCKDTFLNAILVGIIMQSIYEVITYV